MPAVAKHTLRSRDVSHMPVLRAARLNSDDLKPSLQTQTVETVILPFPEREYIDTPRCCRILGCSWTVVQRLHEAGAIDWIDYRRRGHHRICYASVVQYCDRLRRDYTIADRRPSLSHSFPRHRDEDLLPFPLRDTIDIERARICLGYSSRNSVVSLIEAGPFEAYRLLPLSPWRISKSSFQNWLSNNMGRMHAAKVSQ